MTDSSKKSLSIIIWFSILAIYVGCSKTEPVHSRQWIYFDTVVGVKVYGNPAKSELDTIFAIAEDEYARWDSLLDIYSPKSALWILNSSRQGTTKIPVKLSKILRKSFQWRKSTNNMLEPKIGHIVQLWGIGAKGKFVPARSSIDSALELVRKSDLNIIDDTTAIVSGDIKIDLGAFAKGFVVDEIYEKILPICKKNSKIEGFLIDAGRNIRGWNRNRKFTIGIANPRGDGIIGEFQLPQGYGCASAGDYERYFILDGVRYHHIFDPRTGYPARGANACTIIAPDALTADALSTAGVILGENIEKIIDKSEISGILFFEQNGKLKSKSFGNVKISQYGKR